MWQAQQWNVSIPTIIYWDFLWKEYNLCASSWQCITWLLMTLSAFFLRSKSLHTFITDHPQWLAIKQVLLQLLGLGHILASDIELWTLTVTMFHFRPKAKCDYVFTETGDHPQNKVFSSLFKDCLHLKRTYKVSKLTAGFHLHPHTWERRRGPVCWKKGSAT